MKPIRKTSGHFGRTYVILAMLAILAVSGLVGHAAEGTAKVRSIHLGDCQFSTNATTWEPLKVGMMLGPGTWVRTDKSSVVYLFLGLNGPVLKVTPASTLHIKELLIEEVAGETNVTTVLGLTRGRVLGAMKQRATHLTYILELPAMDATFQLKQPGMYALSASGRLVAAAGELKIESYPSDLTGERQSTVIPAGKVFVLTGRAGTGKIVEPRTDEVFEPDPPVCLLPPERPINVPTRGEGLGVDPAKVGFNGPFPKGPSK